MSEEKKIAASPKEARTKSEVALREEATLAWWKERDIFKKSLEKDAPKGEYVFYDGPPFATGLPHYGHLLQSIVKDAIPRYRTMRGYRVERRWGWDCHGLPIENIVEKELGFKHKKDILELGVGKFNDLCRSKVLMYVEEWRRIIPRVGRWADMEKPYFTMSREYMESVWWAFKQLYDKKLVYEDYRSMHICPRCETTLSQSEVAEGYKDVKDLAVTAKFKLKDPKRVGVEDNAYILAWTTTPWTLPGNVALAVGKHIRYEIIKTYVDVERIPGVQGIKMADTSEYYLVAADVFAAKATPVEGTSDRFVYMGKTVLKTGTHRSGADLRGLEYEPLFELSLEGYPAPEKEKFKNAYKVYTAGFVTTEDGTGVVHIAPAFGADDMALGKEEGLPFVQHVGMDGIIKPEVPDLAGRSVKPIEDIQATDVEVVKILAGRNSLFAKEKYEHSYPHCWRCDTPLINYATSSWFVKIEAQKKELLHNARDINWSPKHIKEGRWGKWLEGARDWSISRQRFWASVIPVWRCEGCNKEMVFDSAAALEEMSGVAVDDLHKHKVDTITFACPLEQGGCGKTMRRIPDVLDTWFDSGSVPFAAEHYPFENVDRFKKRSPAHFIGEAQDQTRAWFYYQHVLSTAIFDKRAFDNCIVTGLILAEDGKKMSKKLQNYPDPETIMDKYGSDALRQYLLSSHVVQADNLNFSERGVDEVAKKNIGRLTNVLEFWKLYDDGTARDWKSAHVLDRWILVRLDELIKEVGEGYETYRPDIATRPLPRFIDDLSVWYLRRSRERFKDDTPDKKDALATLRYVLHRLALVMAPSLPFFAEHLFQAVREGEDEESAHLALWPEASATPNFFARLFRRSSSDEALVASMQMARDIVSKALEAREKAGIKVRQPLGRLTADSGKLTEEFIALIRDEVNVKEVVSGKELSLDTQLTPELKEEGIVRELIRSIQQYRKEQGLKPGEETKYVISTTDENRSIVEKYKEKIEAQTNTKLTF